MSDFPNGGDVASSRVWLDSQRCERLFVGWNADALLGADKAYILKHAGEDEGERLWGLLQTARRIAGKLSVLFTLLLNSFLN
jgi:hypothetical protein